MSLITKKQEITMKKLGRKLQEDYVRDERSNPRFFRFQSLLRTTEHSCFNGSDCQSEVLVGEYKAEARILT
jgi:hypothetical protein